MEAVWGEVGLIAALIMLNAFLAGSEVALVALREGQIDRLAKQPGARALLARLARDPNRFLATIQVGITLAGFLASATAAVSLAEPLVARLAFLGTLAEPVAILVVTAVLTFFTLVFGELAPKRMALQRTEGWGVAAARPLALLGGLTRPLVWVLAKATDLTVRAFGGDPSVQRSEIEEEELRELVSSRPGFHRMQRKVLSGAFDIAERTLRQILVPRSEVLFLPAAMDAKEAMGQLVVSGHSRAPVYGEDFDQLEGVVHLRDLVGKEGPLRRQAREVLVLPETQAALAALSEMQRRREQLAVVVDEHGVTEGIVTVEDLLEELVGEIYDEHDRDLRAVEHRADGSLILSGMFPLHDLPDLGVAPPESRSATVGGLVMEELGRVPVVGDQVVLGPWRLEVLDTAGRRVKRLRLWRER